MTISPDFDSFARQYDDGRAQVLVRRIVSDLETPVSAYLKLAREQPNSFLLESVEGGEQLGRYSIIGFKPDAIWRSNGDQAEVNWRAAYAPDTFQPDHLPPLESLKQFIAQSHIELPDDAPPMAAGVFGYFGYDMVRQIERLPNRPGSDLNIADAIYMRPTVVAVFDNIKQEIILVAAARPEKGTDARAAYGRAAERLADAVTLLRAPLTHTPHADSNSGNQEVTSNTPAERFNEMVLRAKEYISAGDIFQVVLSQRFSTPFEKPPFELYRALRRTNPSPFLFFLNFEGHALVGSSPEILVRVRKGDVTIRPIAGTRPRGSTPAEDKELEQELLGDPKERAEHLMLLDLGRNDVGRAAEIGSVRVTEQFIVERYSHVMHIVSNVTGKLAKGVHPVDAVCAGFPAGTVSGAPKIRAMEIIDELETEGRGAYGGCIGYFSADGDVDTCIALRTAVVKDGVMHVQAGAGIVADSVPAMEQAECENKAKALFTAAELASARSGN